MHRTMCFYPWVCLAWANSKISLHAWSAHRLSGGRAGVKAELWAKGEGARGEPASGRTAVWFICVKQMELWRCFLRHPQLSIGLESPEIQTTGNPVGVSYRRTDFEISTDSFMRRIPDFPNFLTGIFYLGGWQGSQELGVLD